MQHCGRGVVFKSLPAYDVLWTVTPTSIRIRSGAGELCFVLNAQVVQERLHVQTVTPNEKNQLLVLLRFRKCSDRGTEDQYPSHLEVVVNGKRQELPKTLGGSRCNHRPIDITASVDFRMLAVNKLYLSWKPDYDYAILISVVRRANTDTLMRRLQADSTRKISDSKALIKTMLSGKTDADVVSKSMKVSLLCPIGRGRISVPVRPLTCNHIQCFDAFQFLRLNETNTTWKCPLCNQIFDFESLRVDGLFSHILNSTDSDEVVFSQDGSWDSSRSNIEICDLCTPQKPKFKMRPATMARKASIVDLTGDTTDEEDDSYAMPLASACNNNKVL